MRLTASGSSFQMTILGYQHPDAAGEPYDANWLSIHVEASGPGGAWTGTDPCLLTYEVVRLADWLGAAAVGKEPARAISFLEPVLLFRLLDEARGRTLRIHFGNLINPSWNLLDTGAPIAHQGASPDLYLDFLLAEADLLQASNQLRDELRRYPDRAEV